MAENAQHFCMVAMPKEALNKTKAAALDDFKWPPGSTIRVRFMEGDPGLKERVKAVAKEWTGPGMAGLSLQFVEEGDAEIRIRFEQGNGSWSYLGTMCKQIPQNQATMNYGWLTPQSSDAEVRSVVLHEFGHALGLIHEHQNPSGAIQWNRDAVIADLSGPPNNWDPETIEHNIFKRYDPREVSGTEVDATSIMMYPIPAAWTLDGFSAGFNGELSEKDKAFIRQAYP